MKRIFLLIFGLLLLSYCKEKTTGTTNATGAAKPVPMQTACDSLNDYAVKTSQATFVPAKEGGDSGEEHLDIKDFGLEQGFEVARNCLSELKDVTFENFKAAGFKHEINSDGVFVTISLNKTDTGVRITYAAGI